MKIESIAYEIAESCLRIFFIARLFKVQYLLDTCHKLKTFIEIAGKQ